MKPLSFTRHLAQVLDVFVLVSQAELPRSLGQLLLRIIGRLPLVMSQNPSAGLDILWSPNTASDHVYLKIDADLSLEKDLEKKRMAFWDEIYKSVGR
ncbi:unnamed protein product [Timema podura]|uniref:Uncharacterized protein n=1 Tax=Timema podura TaxID=61482 RepID=A0ABN7NRG7_TIMPD|nr:unnamed protein product [Timema podura]